MTEQELEARAETLEILNDVETMQAIREADDELANGQTVSFEQIFGHRQPNRHAPRIQR